MDAGIILGDARIVPVRDVPQEDVGDCRLAELEFSGHAGHIVGRDVRTEHGGDVNQLDSARLEEIVSHGHIGCAEVDGPRANLLDATAGTDGLIVDLDAGMRGAVLREPLGIDGIWEGGASGCNCLSLSRAQRAHEQRDEKQGFFHDLLPFGFSAEVYCQRPMLRGVEKNRD